MPILDFQPSDLSSETYTLDIESDSARKRVDLRVSEGLISLMPETSISAEPDIKREFDLLAQRWRSETRHMSLAADKASDFSLHQIIGMGDKALPLILRELESKTTDWFWALRAIARGRAPQIPTEDQGKIRKIADIWIQWGKDNGFLPS